MIKAFYIITLFLGISPLFAENVPTPYFVLAENKDSGIQIIEPWAACSASRNGCVYMTIKSTQDDRLIKAEARQAASKVEIHSHAVDSNGVARMYEVPFLTCPKSQEAVLKPMGDHIMLLGLKNTLVVGQQVDLVLHFEKAGKVHVTAPVKMRQKKCKSCRA